VVSSFSLVIGCAILPGLFLPALAKARIGARAAKSQHMLKQLNGAVLVYAADHDDRLPPVDDWLNALKTIDPQAPILADSIDSQTAGRVYAMNSKLEGKRLSAIQQPDRTVLLFEVGAGAPFAGGPELVPQRSRFPGGHLVLFADGSIEFVNPADMNTLVWSP
jgi:hypothetical protein